jgi:putative membrane protein
MSHTAQTMAQTANANRTLQGMVGVYAVVWIACAIAPHDRSDWLLENALVLAGLGLLLWTRRWFAFSNVSYGLFLLFMCLHAYGANTTYTESPLGDWLQARFDTARNPYDRVVHFAFGLLITYPLRELALRVWKVDGVWSWLLPSAVQMALSAGYEIAEWLAAAVVSPELGTTFVGDQGDPWDAQKDMALAWLGSVIARGAAALLEARRG